MKPKRKEGMFKTIAFFLLVGVMLIVHAMWTVIKTTAQRIKSKFFPNDGPILD